MTSRHRQRLSDFFAPRFWTADTRYGLHVLDSTEREIREGSPADAGRSIVPTGPQGWQHSKSPTIQKCLILIEKGIRGVPLDEVQFAEGLSLDLTELADLAQLSERERDVLALAGSGWRQREIAMWLDVDQATVSRRLHSGRGKLTTRLPAAVAMKLDLVAESA